MVLRWSDLSPTTETINQKMQADGLRMLPRQLEELHSCLIGLTYLFTGEDGEKYKKAAENIKRLAKRLNVDVRGWIAGK